jgi:hypothetical protein
MDRQEIFAVTALRGALGKAMKLIESDISQAQRDLLDTSDAKSLALL